MADQFYPTFVLPLSEEDGGGYVALVPDLYGCTGDGETPEEALADAQKAVVEWCNEMGRLGRPVPAPGSAAERVRSEKALVRRTIRSLKSEFEKLARAIEAKDKLIDSQEREISTLWRRISDLQATLSDLECEDRPSGAEITGWTHADLARIPAHLHPSAAPRKSH